MVKKEIIKDKNNNVMMTKDGLELVEYKLETGDIFIPSYNSIITKSSLIIDNNNIKKTIVTNKIKVKILGYPELKKEIELYITLTPAQAKSLTKKINDGIIINQNLFIAYTYKDKDDNEWVGVGLKGNNVPGKSFEDFKDILDNTKNT